MEFFFLLLVLVCSQNTVFQGFSLNSPIPPALSAKLCQIFVLQLNLFVMIFIIPGFSWTSWLIFFFIKVSRSSLFVLCSFMGSDKFTESFTHLPRTIKNSSNFLKFPVQLLCRHYPSQSPLTTDLFSILTQHCGIGLLQGEMYLGFIHGIMWINICWVVSSRMDVPQFILSIQLLKNLWSVSRFWKLWRKL